MKRSRGIALFQVLLMMAIVSILLVIISGYSRFAVNKTTVASDRLQAKLATYSHWSEIRFKLLTEEWFNAKLNSLPNSNFYGVPFRLDNSTVTLQNQNSLLYIGTGGALLTHLLAQLGVDESKAKQMTDTLEDWSDPNDQRRLLGAEAKEYGPANRPPNLPIQHFYELSYIKGWDPSLVNDIKPFLTLHPNGILNPALMPAELMSYYVSSGEVQVLEENKRNNSYSLEKFSQVTGIQGDEFLQLNPASRIVIKVRQQAEDNSYNTYIYAVLDVRPYKEKPITLREIEWR